MSALYEDTGQRARVMARVRKVVVKVGTRLLTGVRGASTAERVEQLVGALAAMRQQGNEVILVTSGAIGSGMLVLGTPRRPTSLPELQAHAAVGQSHLMFLYETACAKHGFHCGQMLLTAADVKDRERHLNLRSCLDSLLASGVLPVINENDSVSIDEIKFGDNDMLAALVAVMARADLTVLLTSIDGLHEMTDGKLGRRYSVVRRLDDTVRAQAGDTSDHTFSVGGMRTKLRAAEYVTRAGESLVIADGLSFNILADILAGKDVGTLFIGRAPSRMPSHQRFLAFFSRPAGELVIDDGACRALREQGRSLLPSGITAVRGRFARGDTVRVLAADGTEVARGVSCYSAEDAARIAGHRTNEIRALLGCDGDDAVVHRNHMVLS
ncbi:MAG: Glutamate 5-kinase [Lentisphaerae bacterium ADurb.BinA184]|nr:MAG: Glutamate 5-kinase [Lentisphaerae bacterium ADurb.BinA184]